MPLHPRPRLYVPLPHFDGLAALLALHGGVGGVAAGGHGYVVGLISVSTNTAFSPLSRFIVIVSPISLCFRLFEKRMVPLFGVIVLI